jgi:hypothetical protein
VRRLEDLLRVRARVHAIDARFDAIAIEETDRKVAREAALASAADAKGREGDANGRLNQLATSIGGLGTQRSAIAGVLATAVQPTDAIDPDDAAADRILLAERVRDRENRWSGAVTDPELRAQLKALQSAVADLEKKVAEYASEILPARALLAADPSRSADDYRGDAETIRKRVEHLVGRIGELKSEERRLENELKDAKTDFAAIRRPAELATDETTEDIEEASRIRDRLLQRREQATSIRAQREAEQQSVTDKEKVVGARVTLLETSLQRLSASTRPLLSPSGVLVPAVDMAEYEARVDVATVLVSVQPPDPIAALLRVGGHEATDSATLDADKLATATAADQLDQDNDALMRVLVELEARAGETLDATEALLRDAPEEVVRGDRVIHTLRAAPRRTLAELAIVHHRDIEQRLTAIRHHVQMFEARVDALADTVYATIADLLREVRRTVRESQLPNTAAMGRWAGADLLQLGGLDTLRVDQRRSAVGTTLRGWFNPEKPEDRPKRFDSNDVVHALLSAVTPQFSANILIPSDPLDPEHKPVDHLAMETSGGEGVTIALIIASLLASRRASARGHRRTTLLLDNPFAKVTKPEFLRLARDVATELNVQLVAFTGMRDLGALTVFPRLTQLRVSRRETANFVVPYDIDDESLQRLVRDGTLFVSPKEWAAAQGNDEHGTWPLMSAVTVATSPIKGSP